jgi:hypothetical protein
MKLSIRLPVFLSKPDRVFGMPVLRAILPFMALRPIARFQLKLKPYFLIEVYRCASWLLALPMAFLFLAWAREFQSSWRAIWLFQLRLLNKLMGVLGFVGSSI